MEQSNWLSKQPEAKMLLQGFREGFLYPWTSFGSTLQLSLYSMDLSDK